MRTIIILVLVGVALLITFSAMYAEENHKSGEKINWQVISSGGDIDGSSTNFKLSGTASQTAVGVGGSDNFGLSHGFWQEIAAYGVCGDANGDGDVNVGDAVFIINYVFKGGLPPDPVCIGDANGDGGVNVGDAVYLIAYVFKGGPAPVEDCCP